MNIANQAAQQLRRVKWLDILVARGQAPSVPHSRTAISQTLLDHLHKIAYHGMRMGPRWGR